MGGGGGGDGEGRVGKEKPVEFIEANKKKQLDFIYISNNENQLGQG